MRKTRKEKEAEAAEAKRLEEEENAAKAYAEFLETFEGKESSRRGGANFVRADTKATYNPLAESSQVPPSTNVFQRVRTGSFASRGRLLTTPPFSLLLLPAMRRGQKESVRWIRSWKKSNGGPNTALLRESGSNHVSEQAEREAKYGGKGAAEPHVLRPRTELAFRQWEVHNGTGSV